MQFLYSFCSFPNEIDKNEQIQTFYSEFSLALEINQFNAPFFVFF